MLVIGYFLTFDAVWLSLAVFLTFDTCHWLFSLRFMIVIGYFLLRLMHAMAVIGCFPYV
jgi:hypothetical protein